MHSYQSKCQLICSPQGYSSVEKVVRKFSFNFQIFFFNILIGSDELELLDKTELKKMSYLFRQSSWDQCRAFFSCQLLCDFLGNHHFLFISLFFIFFLSCYPLSLLPLYGGGLTCGLFLYWPVTLLEFHCIALPQVKCLCCAHPERQDVDHYTIPLPQAGQLF